MPHTRRYAQEYDILSGANNRWWYHNVYTSSKQNHWAFMRASLTGHLPCFFPFLLFLLLLPLVYLPDCTHYIVVALICSVVARSLIQLFELLQYSPIWDSFLHTYTRTHTLSYSLCVSEYDLTVAIGSESQKFNLHH